MSIQTILTLLSLLFVNASKSDSSGINDLKEIMNARYKVLSDLYFNSNFDYPKGHWDFVPQKKILHAIHKAINDCELHIKKTKIDLTDLQNVFESFLDSAIKKSKNNLITNLEIEKAVKLHRNGYFNDLKLVAMSPKRIKIITDILSDQNIDRLELLNFAASSHKRSDLQKIIFKDLKSKGLGNALAIAAEKEYIYAAQYLLNKKITMEDLKYGLEAAVKDGHLAFVHLFLKRSKSEELIRAGITSAARYDQLRLLESFLKLLKEKYELTPWTLLGGDFMEAYYLKRYSAIKIMLKIFPNLAESNLDFIEPYIDHQMAKEFTKSIRTHL